MRADDLRAVLDASTLTGGLAGRSQREEPSRVFAAKEPERVLALFLFGAYARGAWAPDYPIGQ